MNIEQEIKELKALIISSSMNIEQKIKELKSLIITTNNKIELPPTISIYAYGKDGTVLRCNKCDNEFIESYLSNHMKKCR